MSEPSRGEVVAYEAPDGEVLVDVAVGARRAGPDALAPGENAVRTY